MEKPRSQTTDPSYAAGENARSGAAWRSEGAGRPRGEEMLVQDVAKDWIRDHQDTALLAAFAVGVFMGAWMRG